MRNQVRSAGPGSISNISKDGFIVAAFLCIIYNVSLYVYIYNVDIYAVAGTGTGIYTCCDYSIECSF